MELRHLALALEPLVCVTTTRSWLHSRASRINAEHPVEQKAAPKKISYFLQAEGMHGLPSLPAVPPASVSYPSLEALASIAEGIGTSGGGEVRPKPSRRLGSKHRVISCVCD